MSLFDFLFVPPITEVPLGFHNNFKYLRFFGTNQISVQNLKFKFNFPSHLLTNDSGNQAEE